MSEKEMLENEEYTPELIDLEDEDGNTVTFEIIDGMEFEGSNYFALVPFIEEGEGNEEEFVILKETEKDGEPYLATIDSDEEYDRVGAAFLDRFSEVFETED